MLHRSVEARMHGRYLVRPPDDRGPWPLLVGFHGYRENAATCMAALESIAGTGRWLLVSVQGLHRFYAKGGEVVASWMTKEDRELAIGDNVAYVGRVLEAVRAEFAASGVLVFFGFSQGVAMAFRAAAQFPSAGLIAVAADVPPDVAAGTTVPLPPVLYGRGDRDTLYTVDHHAKDVATLERLGVTVERVTFGGGHELSPEFLAMVSARLRKWGRRSDPI